MSAPRTHDVVVHGASGFVGRLTAAYLARAAPAGTRLALSGRSQSRLEAVRDDLGVDGPLLVADSADHDALAELARSTTAVATTVGPYARHGLPLVAACAAAGTHYADLTGEALFVRDAIDASHDAAVATGARIVTSCGFDSIPSDLGVLLTAEAARTDGAGALTDTTLVLVSARGGFSGGTIDSLRGVVDLVKSDSGKRKVLTDPYSLSPDRAAEPDLGRESDAVGISRVDGRWTGPFVMAPHNTRIVRRSNALQDWAYGRTFRYRELMGFGRTPAGPLLAAATAGGIAFVGAGLALRPTRVLLDRVLPKPGEGPSAATQAKGHFTLEVVAGTESGARYRTTVSAKGDPGYAATAVMLGESALCLALDPLTSGGGVLTPATAMGVSLADRLRSAGFTLTTERL
ncbi:MAG: saccharopine dehydrogenase NADP-binding domain-containing protein [Frankiales bacterium]|nr:saccharopine dehydrogenase NADP-binding domain-containing protein [Frankiales bacterium]